MDEKTTKVLKIAYDRKNGFDLHNEGVNNKLKLKLNICEAGIA